MWTVAENYINDAAYNEAVDLRYIPLSVTGSIAKRLAFAAGGYAKIAADLLTGKPEIMHVHMAERGSVYRKGLAISMGKLAGCKVIVHMHGAEFREWFEALPERKQARVKRIVGKADRVIILGCYWKGFMATVVPASKIDVVYNAVSAPEENRYNADAGNILFLGVVGQRKGAYDLLDAFCSVLEAIPEDVDLVYYGPDFEGRIEDAIREKNAGTRVRYLGWLGKEEKGQVFAETMCNVLPSYNEGLPMTILETMAYGIPNITTDVAAIPEAVDDRNGLVIKPGDKEALGQAIVNICDSRSLRKALSRESFKRVKEIFSIDKHIERILNIYRGVIK